MGCNSVVQAAIFLSIDLATAWTLFNIQKHLPELSRTKLCVTRFYLSAEVSVWVIHLLNPLAILSCIGCSTGMVTNFFVLLSIYGATSDGIWLAGASLAFASYTEFYSILFTVSSFLRIRIFSPFVKQVPLALLIFQKRHSRGVMIFLTSFIAGFSILSVFSNRYQILNNVDLQHGSYPTLL